MVEPVSDFCCQQTETVCHVLWECAFARNAWALARGRIQKCSKAAKYYFLLFRSMMNQLDLHQLETWTVIAWALCGMHLTSFISAIFISYNQRLFSMELLASQQNTSISLQLRRNLNRNFAALFCCFAISGVSACLCRTVLRPLCILQFFHFNIIFYLFTQKKKKKKNYHNCLFACGFFFPLSSLFILF